MDVFRRWLTREEMDEVVLAYWQLKKKKFMDKLMTVENIDEMKKLVEKNRGWFEECVDDLKKTLDELKNKISLIEKVIFIAESLTTND